MEKETQSAVEAAAPSNPNAASAAAASPGTPRVPVHSPKTRAWIRKLHYIFVLNVAIADFVNISGAWVGYDKHVDVAFLLLVFLNTISAFTLMYIEDE